MNANEYEISRLCSNCRNSVSVIVPMGVLLADFLETRMEKANPVICRVCGCAGLNYMVSLDHD